MPWCDECDRIVADDDLVEGACPTCTTQIVAPERGPLPWRFRFMIAATIVYLGWRIYQGVSWLIT